jgi:hypothetical protein
LVLEDGDSILHIVHLLLRQHATTCAIAGAEPTLVEGAARVAGSREGAPQLRRDQLLQTLNA